MDSYKIAKCDSFVKMLNDFRINHERHSTYHVQIQIEHNFYPSKGTYYNSETGKKSNIPEFKNADEIFKFIREKNSGKIKIIKFTSEEVVELLEASTSLKSAINYFKNL